MFVWNFNVLIAVLVTLGLGLVFGLWLFYTKDTGHEEAPGHGEFFRQCGFCGYLFFDYGLRGRCPRCASWQA